MLKATRLSSVHQEATHPFLKRRETVVPFKNYIYKKSKHRWDISRGKNALLVDPHVTHEISLLTIS